MADGIFLGLQHQRSQRGASRSPTSRSRSTSYENTDWAWITAPASASGSFSANINVPADTPYGMYSGAIVLDNGDDSMVVPVAVAVAASPAQDAAGAITGTLEFGGADVAEAQADHLYNNGSVFGANDWAWRAESGDWRFFFSTWPMSRPHGTLFLARTDWDGDAPVHRHRHADHGPLREPLPAASATALFGAPYIIDTVGGSPNTNTGAGVWRFDTATGGAEDFVAAPAQEGLHAFVLHQVGWDGDDFHDAVLGHGRRRLGDAGRRRRRHDGRRRHAST